MCAASRSPRLPRGRQEPGEWATGRGSAKPIVCDRPQDRPTRGGRDPDNREQGRRDAPSLPRAWPGQCGRITAWSSPATSERRSTRTISPTPSLGCAGRAGLGHWHPHELRHSGASPTLAQDTPLHVVSDYGHLVESPNGLAERSRRPTWACGLAARELISVWIFRLDGRTASLQ